MSFVGRPAPRGLVSPRTFGARDRETAAGSPAAPTHTYVTRSSSEQGVETDEWIHDGDVETRLDRGRPGPGGGRSGQLRASPREEEAQHPDHLGRRHRLLEHQRLQPGHDGLQDAEHRPHRQGRRAVHRLVRRAELHRRPLRVHHGAERLPHRQPQGRPARRQGRPAGARRDARAAAQGPGLHDRAVRQEPPRRRRRDAADRARVRRVHGLALPPQRRAGAREPRLLQGSGADQEVRHARRDPHLGQPGRHAEDRAAPARSPRSAWRRSTRRSPRPRSTTWRRRRRPTSRSSSGGTPPACTSSRTSRRRARARPASASIPTAWSSTTRWSASCSTSSRSSASRTTPSSCTRPTTAPRRCRGPTAARRRSAARRTPTGKAATACPAPSAGPASSSPARSATTSTRTWT